MCFSEPTVVASHIDQVGQKLRPVAHRLLAASTLLLLREDRTILLLERSPNGHVLDAICQRGRRSGFAGVDAGTQSVIQTVRREGAKLIDELVQIWPNYAVPDNLGIITDGQDIYFSPDMPSAQDEDWFLQAAWGEMRLCSLLGRRTPISQLLISKKTAIIH